MNTLYNKVVNGIQQVSMYRRPNLGDLKERLDEVLVAMGAVPIGHDSIIGMYVEEHSDLGVPALHIDTEYTLRGCGMTGEHLIPMSIIEARDPIVAAKVYVKSREIRDEKDLLEVHQEELNGIDDRKIKLRLMIESTRDRITTLEQELIELTTHN